MLRLVAIVRTDVSEDRRAFWLRRRYVPPKRRFLTRATRRNIPEDVILQTVNTVKGIFLFLKFNTYRRYVVHCSMVETDHCFVHN
jgi:hypothetical protein